MEDGELIRAFEACTLQGGEFRHREHVRLAWLYLREHPVPVVLMKLSEGLQRLARALGKEGLYHETITFAYVLLIRERMERGGQLSCWDDFAAQNPDLLDRAAPILDRYYCRATLESDLARRVFVFPDGVKPAPPER